MPSTLFHPVSRVSALALAAGMGCAGQAIAEIDPSDEYAGSLASYQLARPGLPTEPGLVMLRRDALADGWRDQGRDLVPGTLQRPVWRYGVLPGIPSLRMRQQDMSGANAWLERGNWFAGAGLGRTTLLRTEPLAASSSVGDVYMLRGGYSWRGRESLSLQLVRDNRPQADQRTVQLVYGTAMPGNALLSVGVASTSGLAGGAPVQRVGLSVGYDWPRYFVQLAYDPKVLWSAQELRLSAGTRF